MIGLRASLSILFSLVAVVNEIISRLIASEAASMIRAAIIQDESGVWKYTDGTPYIGEYQRCRLCKIEKPAALALYHRGSKKTL